MPTSTSIYMFAHRCRNPQSHAHAYAHAHMHMHMETRVCTHIILSSLTKRPPLSPRRSAAPMQWNLCWLMQKPLSPHRCRRSPRMRSQQWLLPRRQLRWTPSPSSASSPTRRSPSAPAMSAASAVVYWAYVSHLLPFSSRFAPSFLPTSCRHPLDNRHRCFHLLPVCLLSFPSHPPCTRTSRPHYPLPSPFIFALARSRARPPPPRRYSDHRCCRNRCFATATIPRVRGGLSLSRTRPPPTGQGRG